MAGEAGGAAVRFAGVSIAFPACGGGATRAVEATDLTVGGKEFVVIVGPTGCGKTTLLNMAAGLLLPHAGEIIVVGGWTPSSARPRPPTRQRRRRRLHRHSSRF